MIFTFTTVALYQSAKYLFNQKSIKCHRLFHSENKIKHTKETVIHMLQSLHLYILKLASKHKCVLRFLYNSLSCEKQSFSCILLHLWRIFCNIPTTNGVFCRIHWAKTNTHCSRNHSSFLQMINESEVILNCFSTWS